MNTPLKRLHIIGILEGLSYILLLGIAMPLKYMFDMPLMVKYTGWAHGLLFVLYLAAAVHAAYVYRWSLLTLAAAFISSVLPFGPFIFDAWAVKKEKARMQQNPR